MLSKNISQYISLFTLNLKVLHKDTAKSCMIQKFRTEKNTACTLPKEEFTLYLFSITASDFFLWYKFEPQNKVFFNIVNFNMYL